MFDSTEFFEKLQEIIQRLEEILKSNTEIDEIFYFEIVGDYSKELNVLLKKYSEADDEIQNVLRPFVNYYRQLQHYLVYIVRYPEILKVPHHSEMLQTLSFIENQEKLIKEKYADFSAAQKELLTGEFTQVLEEFFELRFKKIKKNNHRV